MRLIVMRHAKSSWDSGAASDHERPLNKRGQRDAPRVATELRDRGWVPDFVWSSDSQRTRETWARMADVLGEPPVRFTRTLYHAGMGGFDEVVSGTSDSVGTLLVLGHNPGWESVVGWLSGVHTTLTTANAALLERDAASWRPVLGGWSLIDVIRPRDLD